MMTTLQRSSVSFRRQGSSGRIWENNNRLQLSEKNTNVGAGSDNQEKKIVPNEEIAESTNRLPVSPSPVVTKVNSSSISPKSSSSPRSSSSGHNHNSNNNNKGQKCAFVSIFGRCIGSPTAAASS